MAYEPTEWKCGDTITAEKLNKLEEAVANAGGGAEPLIIRFTGETVSLGDTTFKLTDTLASDAYNAFVSGRSVMVVNNDDEYSLVSWASDSSVAYGSNRLSVAPPTNGHLALVSTSEPT